MSADLHHVAVVPVSAVDSATTEALRYAATLAPNVLAIHIREPDDPDALEAVWVQAEASSPLVVMDAPDGDYARAFGRALDVLVRSEQRCQIAVVVPFGHQRMDWRDACRFPSAVIFTRTAAGWEGRS